MTGEDHRAFWNDLEKDLADPDLRAHYLLESERIAAVDRMINQLDDLRVELGLSWLARSSASPRLSDDYSPLGQRTHN